MRTLWRRGLSRGGKGAGDRFDSDVRGSTPGSSRNGEDILSFVTCIDRRWLQNELVVRIKLGKERGLKVCY